MGRRALFEKYISGLKAKKEDKIVSAKMRWITFDGSSGDFTESNLMSFLGVYGLDIAVLCKVLQEQASFYKSSQVLSVKLELSEDKTFRVFLSIPDKFVVKGSVVGGLGEVCQYALISKRAEVKVNNVFLSHLRAVLNKVSIMRSF